MSVIIIFDQVSLMLNYQDPSLMVICYVLEMIMEMTSIKVIIRRIGNNIDRYTYNGEIR